MDNVFDLSELSWLASVLDASAGRSNEKRELIGGGKSCFLWACSSVFWSLEFQELGCDSLVLKSAFAESAAPFSYEAG